jgi:CPA2 family monovalent cation:H+ antiporter-2
VNAGITETKVIDVEVPSVEIMDVENPLSFIPRLWTQLEIYTPFLWLLLTILIASPFLWGILRGMPPHAEHHDTETLTRLQQLQFGIATVRFLLGTAMVAFFVSNFRFTEFPILSGFASVAGIVGFLFVCDRPFGWFYHRIESRFVSHLSDKERSVVEDRAAMAHLVPWEATLTEFTLSEYSPLVMKTLLDSDLKQKFGVTVAVIKRGEKNIVAPRAMEILLPRDHLYLIGTYEQLFSAQVEIEYRPELEEDDNDQIGEQFGMVPLRLRQDHTFVGKAIRDCGIRESVHGLIVGLEREGNRFLNPEPSMVLQGGDLIWLVGEKPLLAKL